MVLGFYLKYLGNSLMELYTKLMLEPPREFLSPSKTESDVESQTDIVSFSLPNSPQKKDIDEK